MRVLSDSKSKKMKEIKAAYDNNSVIPWSRGDISIRYDPSSEATGSIAKVYRTKIAEAVEKDSKKSSIIEGRMPTLVKLVGASNEDFNTTLTFVRCWEEDSFGSFGSAPVKTKRYILNDGTELKVRWGCWRCALQRFH